MTCNCGIYNTATGRRTHLNEMEEDARQFSAVEAGKGPRKDVDVIPISERFEVVRGQSELRTISIEPSPLRLEEFKGGNYSFIVKSKK